MKWLILVIKLILVKLPIFSIAMLLNEKELAAAVTLPFQYLIDGNSSSLLILLPTSLVGLFTNTLTISWVLIELFCWFLVEKLEVVIRYGTLLCLTVVCSCTTPSSDEFYRNVELTASMDSVQTSNFKTLNKDKQYIAYTGYIYVLYGDNITIGDINYEYTAIPLDRFQAIRNWDFIKRNNFIYTLTYYSLN